MTKEEKTIQLLSQMPEPYRTLALENFEDYPLEILHEPKNIADAIIDSFDWFATKQGFRFWQAVRYHYALNKPLPIKESVLSDSTKESLLGKVITEVGDNWIQLNSGRKIYLEDSEVDNLN